MLDDPVLPWQDARLHKLRDLFVYAYPDLEPAKNFVADVDLDLRVDIDWRFGARLFWRDAFTKAAARGLLRSLVGKAMEDPTIPGFRDRIAEAVAACEAPAAETAGRAFGASGPSAGGPVVRLPGPRVEQLHEALVRGFPDPRRLGELLRPLNRDLAELAPGFTFPEAVRTVIRAAEAQGWLLDLLARALAVVADPQLHDLDADLRRVLPAVESPDPAAPSGTDHLVVAVSPAGTDDAAFTGRLRERLAGLRATIELRLQPAAPAGAAFPSPLSGYDVLLFVATPESLAPGSPGRRELDSATATRLDVIALIAASGVDRAALPAGVPAVELTDGSGAGWTELDRQLDFLASPLRVLWSLAERREALRRQQDRAAAPEHERYAAAIADLDSRILSQRRRLDDLPASMDRVAESILARWEREQRPAPPPARSSPLRCVNAPPAVPPNQFRDRVPQRRRLEEWLRDPARRLTLLPGPHGMGKTAVIAEVLRRIREAESDLRLDGFVYLPVHGFRPVDAPALLDALAEVVPDAALTGPPGELPHRRLSWLDRLDEVLTELGRRDVVVVIDNVEALLDADAGFRDRHLGELLSYLVRRDEHRVRLVLVTQRIPQPLAGEFRAGADISLDLTDGLPLPHSYDMLQALFTRGGMPMVTVEEHEKELLQRYTGGSPRAIELVFAILRDRPDRPFSWVLGLIRGKGAEVVEFLVSWVFERLDPLEKRVLQALAACRRPVPATTVDFVLEDYLPGFESAPVLAGLRARGLIRADGDAYYLPPSPDAELVLRSVRPSTADQLGSGLRYTPTELFRRAADYVSRARRAPDRVRRVEDLRAEFTEIELRICGGQYDLAVDLSQAIDDAYLVRWGYSDALVPALLEVPDGRLDRRRELYRLFLLVRAYRLHGRPDRVIEYGRRALRLTARSQDRVNHARLLLQIGGAHFDQGQVDRAARCFRQALWWARIGWIRPERALAWHNLSACAAARGRFGRALRRTRTAARIHAAHPGPDDPYLAAESLLTAGWVHRGQGRTEDARYAIARARRTAAELGHDMLVSQCLEAEAELLIDEGAPAFAITKARRAATIRGRGDNPSLYRDAREILALASLCAGDLTGAAAAVDVLGRHHGSPLGWALKGIIALRRADPAGAVAAFTAGYELVEHLHERGCADFRMLDMCGLLLCGLALSGQGQHLPAGLAAYRSARRLTRAPGAVLAGLQVLVQFGEEVDQEMLAQARRAAAGRPRRLG